MATTVYLTNTAADTHRGTNTAKLNGSTSGWLPKATSIARGSGVTASSATSTVAGPTNGIEVISGSTPLEWISPPVDQDVTISGTITANIWAAESSMTADASINFYIDKMAAGTGTLTRIVKSARTTEMALTTRAVNNFTATPTSTALNKGDRLVISIFGDDITTSMVTGFTFNASFNGATAAADGDTYLSFTETFGFQSELGAAVITQTTGAGTTSERVQGVGAGQFEKVAQGFTLGATTTLVAADLMLSKQASPADTTTLDVVATLDGTVLGTASTSSAGLPTDPPSTDTRFTFTTPVTLAAGTYYLQLSRSGARDLTNYIRWVGTLSDVYAGGALTMRNNGTWGAGAFINEARFTLYGSSLAGSTLYLTDTASDVATANVDREAWTSRGGSAANDVTNTSAGWTAPVQVTDTAGGTAVSWFTKPLEAFTLSGLVKVNRRVLESNAAANASVGVEIARVDEDGTNAVVWGYANRDAATTSGGAGEIATTETAYTCYVAGDDLAVTDGQRLRIRLFHDDCADVPLVTGHSLTSYYGGPTAGASGDTYLILGQTLTEFAGGGGATVTPATIARSITVPQVIQTTTASVTPATVSRSVTIDQASAGAATSQTPATIARAVTVPQASPQAGVSVTPATIARSVTVPAASPQLGTSVTPVTVSRAVSVPQSAGGAFASPTPATIARALTTPQASPQAGASVTPALIARSVAIDQATTVTGFTWANTAEGGTDETTVTTGNSGGSSGNAWSAVITGAGASVAFDSAEAPSDTMGYRITSASGVNSYLRWDIATPTTLYTRACFKISSLPAANTVAFRTSESDLTQGWGIRISPAGVVDFLNMSSIVAATFSATMPVDQWVKIEVKAVQAAGATGTYELKWYDDPNSTTPDETLSGGSVAFGVGGFAEVRFGSILGTGYFPTIWFDNVATSDAAYPTVTDAFPSAAGATVTPATIATTLAVPQASPQAGASLTPATIARSVAIAQAGPQAAASVTPALIARAIAIDQVAATAGAGASVTPATIARAIGIDPVTAGGGASVTPATVARSVTIPQAGPVAAASVTPTTIARAVTIDQVIRTAGASVTPATIARSVAIDQAARALGASLTPATIARAIAVLAPSVTAGGGATLVPDTIARAIAIGQASGTGSSTASVTPATIAALVAAGLASPQLGASVVPATIASALAVPQAALQAAAVLTPATIARSVVVLAPIVTAGGGATRIPDTIARAFAVDQVSPQLGASASPALIARAFAIDQATGIGATSTTPATIARAFAIPLPGVITASTATMTPDTIALAIAVPQVGQRAGATLTPALVALAVLVPQVTRTASFAITPALIARAIVVGQVGISAAARVSPAAIARAFVITQTIGIGTDVPPFLITVLARLVDGAWIMELAEGPWSPGEPRSRWDVGAPHPAREMELV